MSLIDTGNYSLMFGMTILVSLIVISHEYYEDIYNYFLTRYTIDDSYNTKILLTIAAVCLFITFLFMVAFKHYLVVTGSKLYMSEGYYEREE